MSIPECFLVVVKCMTYNHHAYIEDAMNGFCMQKTDFPYICIVMDDCSTDGEQEVIKNYVDEHFNMLSTEETDDYVLNLCQHKTNEMCYFAVFYLKYNHWTAKKSKIPYYSRWQDKCKYIALCEGDDYWIDERKLQTQVDFLEKNEEYGMCYTNFNMLEQRTQKISYNHFFQKLHFNPECYDLGEWIISLGYKAPMTWVFKSELMNNYVPLNSCDGTFVLVAHFLANSKIKCLINNTTAVYRKLEESASHSNDLNKIYRRVSNLFEVQKQLIKQYNLSNNITNICIKNFYTTYWKLFILMNDVNRINEALKIENNIIKSVLLFFGKNKFFSKLFSKLYILLKKIKKCISKSNPNF